jgi:hypothetical protein
MPIEPPSDFEGQPSYSLTAYHQVGDDYPVFVNLSMTVENFDAFPPEQADAAFQELVDLLAQSTYFTGSNGSPLKGNKTWSTSHGSAITQTDPDAAPDPSA